MKTPSERGTIGAWAYQARQELGMSVEQVADAMAAKGQAVSPATIRGIESGSKKPGARLLKVMRDVLGDAPEAATSSASTSGDIAAAIREQTEVFRDLIEETQREAREAKRRADLLERLVVSLLAPAVEASPDPTAIRVMREWGEAALANMPSRQPAGDPVE